MLVEIIFDKASRISVERWTLLDHASMDHAQTNTLRYSRGDSNRGLPNNVPAYDH